MPGALKALSFRSAFAVIVPCLCLSSLFACAPIQGYPLDPEDMSVALQNLKPYFDGTVESKYLVEPDDAARTRIRNRIIYARTRGYDIEFSDFQKSLYSQSNIISAGSDLAGLVLGGLTATTGNAATKAALGAASVGILGANAAISKDLYYQKTIVAMIAQMDANREGQTADRSRAQIA
jgi:hypothetical protein